MKTVSFTEFRRNASQVMDEVEKGETVRILRHGKEVARIVPPDLAGRTPAWKRPGLRLVVPGASLSRAVLDERTVSP